MTGDHITSAASNFPTRITKPTYREVFNWMRLQLDAEQVDLAYHNECRFYDMCGEPQYTALAEAAADEFDHDEWLDDPDHWVWDAAIEAF